MIIVTPTAAAEIRRSAETSGCAGLHLRLAARVTEEGEMEYGMGFDDIDFDPADLRLISEGVELVVDPASMEMMEGTTLDYVEIEPGKFVFIFMNPNDVNFEPPKED